MCINLQENEEWMKKKATTFEKYKTEKVMCDCEDMGKTLSY
jgi:hypothetical protein